jgi:peptidoglycan/LPS O-acetylase OafA/YrhL
MAFLVGLAPTLAANAINAGSPFATTYGGVDAAPPELNATVLWSYLADVQFILLAIAAAWTALIWRWNDRKSARHAALVVAGNLVVNVIFFLTHPVFTPYYTIPTAMLSLWTLLFATLRPRRQSVADNRAFAQPAKA